MILDPSRITVAIDDPFLAAAVFIDGNLEWAHDAEDVAEHVAYLLGENDYPDFRDQEKALRELSLRYGFEVMDVATIFPNDDGRWANAVKTLDALRALPENQN